MSDIAIRAEGLGKKYAIGRARSGDLRTQFSATLSRLFSRDQSASEFWALRDLDFEVRKGDVVGIIGRNGAGKSTLLKILSRITEPTTGRFEIDGRVSSLLEVGTGFHMELTGRENIYLNGTILGMRRAEIKRKFDEIVAFSGVEKFIDTAVKHYSSGMKVRLAFSVAAHLEPEILIVDEVLAVGDAEFQKKCLGKMDEVSKKDGRTVLFVSHNMAAVVQLCRSGMLLRDGCLDGVGPISDMVLKYNTDSMPTNGASLRNLSTRKGNGSFRVVSIALADGNLQHSSLASTGAEVNFIVTFNRTITKNPGFRIDFALDNELGLRVGWFSSEAIIPELADEFSEIRLRIPKFPYGKGRYHLTFYTTVYGVVVDYLHQGFCFDVEEGDFFGTGRIIPKKETFFYLEHEIRS